MTNEEHLAFFCDATFPDGTSGGRIVSVSVAAPWTEFEARRAAIRKFAQMRRKRALFEVMEFLNNDRAFLVAAVSIDRSAVYGKGLLSRDESSDIGTTSRTDHLWGQALGYSVTSLIPTISRYWKLWPITVFYDARRLNPDFRQRVEEGIRSIVSRLGTEALPELGRTGKIQITRVVAVRKPQPGEAFQFENDGIWLADATASLVTTRPESEFSPNFIFGDATSAASTVADAIAHGAIKGLTASQGD